jgi:fused signal recognition particle receptor
LAEQLDAALGRVGGDRDASWHAVEEALVATDVGVHTATELVGRVRARLPSGGADEIRHAVRTEIALLLNGEPAPTPSVRPWVILVVGVNGVGKTTTVGKLGALYAAEGRRTLLVGADTFRAAAGEQLAVWATRIGAEVVAQRPGADPSAVAFDGIRAALARKTDVVLVDTAGRLHTRTNLMEELRKIWRVIAREVPGGPHETLLVLDATAGQNALSQARMFSEAVPVTGAVLTKLDGTARGGMAIAVRSELGVPIRYIGLGEGVDDLRPFDPEQFADALFDTGAASPLIARQLP